MKIDEPKQLGTEAQVPEQKITEQQIPPVKPARKINIIGLVSIIVLFLLITGVVLLASMSKTEQDTEQHAAEKNTNAAKKPQKMKNPVPGRVVIKRRVGISAATVDAAVAKKFKATTRNNLPQIRTQVLNVPVGQEDAVIAELKKDPMIEYIGRVGYVRAASDPNDPRFSDQWNLPAISAPDAWNTTKGQGAKVGIIDTGIEKTHPDLKGKVIAGKDFICKEGDATERGPCTPTFQDENGHGTHVAGIVAAITNNKIGVASGCPDCGLIIAKALTAPEGSEARGTTDDITEAIIWAADQGAQVINMSLTTDEPGEGNFTCGAFKELKDAVNYAWDKGVVVVAAAGNESKNSVTYPGGFENVIAVGAVDKDNKKGDFSNYGADWVDVAAPGVEILSTWRVSSSQDNAYNVMKGTSMASPHVAGVAALVIASGVKSNDEVISRIESTTDKIEGQGSDWAHGLVNAASAVSGKEAEDPNTEQQSQRKPKIAAIDPTQPCGDEPAPIDEPTKEPGKDATPTPGDGGQNPTTTPGTTQPPATPTFVCLASPNCGQTGTPTIGVPSFTPGAGGIPPGTPDWLSILRERLEEMRLRLQEASDELRQRMEQLRIDLQNRLSGARPTPPSIPNQ